MLPTALPPATYSQGSFSSSICLRINLWSAAISPLHWWLVFLLLLLQLHSSRCCVLLRCFNSRLL
jgi:hypothetical protein